MTLSKSCYPSEPYLPNGDNDTYPRGFVHSFSKYLSETYYGSATVLSIRDTVMNKTDKAHGLILMMSSEKGRNETHDCADNCHELGDEAIKHLVL